jgi:hypothetical protein
MNELKKYAPTQFLSQLTKTYEGNILESHGAKFVQDYLQKIIDNDTSDDTTDYSPIIPFARGVSTVTVSTKIQSNTSIRNTFMESHPSWIYKYDFYDSSQFKDTLAYAFFRTFDPMFPYIPMEQQYEWIREYKYAILSEFLKQGYYQKCSYSATTDFKKSDLDDIFGMNRPITISMVRVLCDVFQINLIWISHDGVVHCPSICQNDDQLSWILVEDYEKGWYVIHPTDHQYYTYGEIKKFFHSSIPSMLTDKYNLDDLQKWARLFGIDHKKEGKTGKKNKLKEELLEEINNKRKNPEK